MPDFEALPLPPAPKPAPPPSSHYFLDDLPYADKRGNICESECLLCHKTFRGQYRGMPEQKVFSHLRQVHKIDKPRRSWRRPKGRS